MIKGILFSTLFVAVAAQAAGKKSAEKIKLKPECEQQIADVVFDRFGRYDETFSVFGYKVIYQGFMTELAIVRTSDEVEPRDVLVSVEPVMVKKQSKCQVKYLETVGDGSVADLDAELVELTVEPRLIPQKHFELKGTIASVTTGEIDALGEACLLEVKTEDGQQFGLVTDQWQCDEASGKIKKGAALTAQIHKGDRYKKKGDLEALRQMFKAARFFKVPFDQIKVQ